MKSSFFDSLNGDRRYSSADWAKYFRQFIGNGVYADPAVSMQVQAAGGMQVLIAEGACFINGYHGYADGSDVLTLEHGGTSPRIDLAVIRLDMAKRCIYPALIKGKPSVSPAAGAIVRNGTFYDLCIAEIFVDENASEIKQSDITDTRYGDLCGVVTGLIDQIDTAGFFIQWQKALDDFIASLGSNDHITINVADTKARSGILAARLERPLAQHFSLI